MRGPRCLYLSPPGSGAGIAVPHLSVPGCDVPDAGGAHHFKYNKSTFSSSRLANAETRCGGRGGRGAKPRIAPGDAPAAAGPHATPAPPSRAHSPQPPRRRGPARAGRAPAGEPDGWGSPCRPSPRSALPARRPAELGPGLSDSAPRPPAAFGLGGAASHPPRRSRRPGVGTGAGAGRGGAGRATPLLPSPLPPASPASGTAGSRRPSVRPQRAWSERGAGGFPAWELR